MNKRSLMALRSLRRMADFYTRTLPDGPRRAVEGIVERAFDMMASGCHPDLPEMMVLPEEILAPLMIAREGLMLRGELPRMPTDPERLHGRVPKIAAVPARYSLLDEEPEPPSTPGRSVVVVETVGVLRLPQVAEEIAGLEGRVPLVELREAWVE